MGPNNVAGTPNVQKQPVAPSGADAVEQALASMPMEPNPNTPPMGMTQKKSGKGMLYGMIIFAILAIGGISFGVWAMLDGNSKVANLEKQVTDLRAQNNKLLEQLAEGGEKNDGSTTTIYNNPVVVSQDTSKEYSVNFSSSVIDNKSVNISVINGVVQSCKVLDGGIGSIDCVVPEFDKKIYYVTEFGAGQDNSGNYVGFIMDDGTVKYVSLNDLINNSVTVGNLIISGPVVNAIKGEVVRSDGIGYGTTFFVLNDGSFVEFHNSMLE